MSENEKKPAPQVMDVDTKKRLERVGIVVGALSDLPPAERALVLNAAEVILGDDER